MIVEIGENLAAVLVAMIPAVVFWCILWWATKD